MSDEIDYFATPGQFDIIDGLEHYENTEGAVLIDVRMKAEYDEGHIPDAINLPLQKIDKLIEKRVPDKETPLFLYCVTGARSGRATSIVKSMGYTRAYNIGGVIGYEGELVKD